MENSQLLENFPVKTALQEIDELKAEIARLKDIPAGGWAKDCEKEQLEEDVHEGRLEIARLRDTLKWYSDKNNHLNVDVVGCGSCMAKDICELDEANCLISHYPSNVDRDNGQRAREALK